MSNSEVVENNLKAGQDGYVMTENKEEFDREHDLGQQYQIGAIMAKAVEDRIDWKNTTPEFREFFVLGNPDVKDAIEEARHLLANPPPPITDEMLNDFSEVNEADDYDPLQTHKMTLGEYFVQQIKMCENPEFSDCEGNNNWLQREYGINVSEFNAAIEFLGKLRV